MRLLFPALSIPPWLQRKSTASPPSPRVAAPPRGVGSLGDNRENVNTRAQRRPRTEKEQAGAERDLVVQSHSSVSFRLPLNDATPEALRAYRDANAHFRTVPWPSPFDSTKHHIHYGDARELSWIPDSSVHLVVTSPPYWTLKEYAPGNAAQLGDLASHEEFLSELDKVCQRPSPQSKPGEIQSAWK